MTRQFYVWTLPDICNTDMPWEFQNKGVVLNGYTVHGVDNYVQSQHVYMSLYF